MDDKIKTKLWLDGYLRQWAATGQSYTIIHKGDSESGILALKIVLPQRQGCRVLIQQRDLDGDMGWFAGFEGNLTPEPEVDVYLSRLAERDPDVWVVELESRDGSHPFPGKMF